VKLHLLTTDASAFDLAGLLPPHDTIVAVIVPENRSGAEKVAAVRRRSPVPCFVHTRGARLSGELPVADAAISWLYSQIIDPADLARYPNGVLNMHGGKIPEYRGANVLQWAIINGETEMGITWHEMAAEVDAGPIWAETTIPIPASATALEMRTAMIAAAIHLFPAAWKAFSRRVGAPRKPDLSRGRVWPPRRPKDGEIGELWCSARVRNLVRALPKPWPPAWIESDGTRYAVRAVHDGPAADRMPYRTGEGAILYLELDGEA
jgi:methionyl-tRNA formyltransferase